MMIVKTVLLRNKKTDDKMIKVKGEDKLKNINIFNQFTSLKLILPFNFNLFIIGLEKHKG